ncbi:hypothetical protein [Eisenibacter elegans]|uniref:hypothetical protein n=1 Tax=Eisenibacter elegans TaxID=997 RepID=UPI00041E87E0|nr:hypothetical protein [Eisenibacter elegans]
MMTDFANTTETLLENNYAKVYHIANSNTVVCEAKTAFIPKTAFMALFEDIAKHAERLFVTKLIFDKRALQTFDQASMTWYHVTWKPKMARLGLKTYRKLLPNDKVFQMSVEIGRKRIADEHPTFKFEDYDIQYCNTIEEALTK